MTKQQLIAALKLYNDDAEIVVANGDEWYDLHIREYTVGRNVIDGGGTLDHVVIEIGDCVME